MPNHRLGFAEAYQDTEFGFPWGGRGGGGMSKGCDKMKETVLFPEALDSKDLYSGEMGSASSTWHLKCRISVGAVQRRPGAPVKVSG
jgi:hypothetical protein